MFLQDDAQAPNFQMQFVVIPADTSDEQPRAIL
jgi:hypothetical protein